MFKPLFGAVTVRVWRPGACRDASVPELTQVAAVKAKRSVNIPSLEVQGGGRASSHAAGTDQP